MARAVLARAREVAPEALPALLEAARGELEPAEITALEDWLAE